MEPLQHGLDFAIETAYLAGQLTLGYFQTDLHTDNKGDGSLVTEADRKAEQLIRARISQYFPEHAVIGEEYGQSDPKPTAYRWIIDPIDGTRAFTCGVPLYAVLIALEIDRSAVLGVAYFPALQQMLYAASGFGAYLNGRKVWANHQARSISEGVVTFTDERNFSRHGVEAPWGKIKNKAGYVSGWGDAYGYLLLATGQTLLHVDPIMKIWDCAPFQPIIKEAGGYFGDWYGNETIYCQRSMAMPTQLLPEILSITTTTVF